MYKGQSIQRKVTKEEMDLRQKVREGVGVIRSGLGISELLWHMRASHIANSYRRAGSQKVWRGIEDVIA
jgi:hypothetical protein